MSALRPLSSPSSSAAVTMLVAVALVALASSSHHAALAAPNADTCSNRVAACNASADYFGTKINLAHATSVTSLQYFGTYAIAQMMWTAWSGTHQQTLVFVRCGCPAPDVTTLPGIVKTIFVPISSVLIQETVAVPKLYLLGQRSKVAAVASVQFVTTPELRDDVANGAVADIANNYTRLLTLPGGLPDVLLTGTGANTGRRGWTAAMTERQVLDSDAGETSPLGRAELVKLTALMTGAEDAANTIFSLIVSRYNEAKGVASRLVTRRPTVLIGVPFTGFGWSVTRGTSYIGRFVRDAGALYRNFDDSLNTLLGTTTNYTAMLQYFAKTDFWLNAAYSVPLGATYNMDVLASGNQTGAPGGDRSVFAQIEAFQCGRVLSNDAALVPGLPGNPFFELGVVRPDLILLDLVYFLHPYARSAALLSGYVPRFYRTLAPLSSRAGVPECPVTSLPIPLPATRSALTVQYTLPGVDVFALRDAMYPAVSSALVAALGAPAAAVEVYTLAATLGAAQPQVTLGVSVSVPVCSACPESASNASSDCSVAVVRNAEGLAAQLPTLLSAAAPALGDLSAVRVVAAEPALVCASGASVPARDLPGYGPGSAGLSRGAKVGLGVGIACGCLVLALAAVVAFKVGHRRGYATLIAQQQPIDVSMRAVPNGKQVNAVA